MGNKIGLAVKLSENIAASEISIQNQSRIEDIAFTHINIILFYLRSGRLETYMPVYMVVITIQKERKTFKRQAFSLLIKLKSKSTE